MPAMWGKLYANLAPVAVIMMMMQQMTRCTLLSLRAPAVKREHTTMPS